MIAFGPIPSRRLGRSLGINNIPHKVCTYSCLYCQVGRTIHFQVERQDYYQPELILEDVRAKVDNLRKRGESIDYLTFVADGEPTLDINLGQEIDLLSQLGIKTAVITNASLVWREDVREDLNKADWVSVKIDSTREETWRRINRPHKNLQLASILKGILEFSTEYEGELVTETLLVKGVNDSDEQVKEVAEFLSQIKKATCYLSIPTRPTAEKRAQPPDEAVINRACQIFAKRIENVEYLIGYEGNVYAFSGDVEKDLLSITAVHPMREDAVKAFLGKAKAEWSTIEGLISQGKLIETEYEGEKFYLRRLHKDLGKKE